MRKFIFIFALILMGCGSQSGITDQTLLDGAPIEDHILADQLIEKFRKEAEAQGKEFILLPTIKVQEQDTIKVIIIPKSD